MRKKNQNRFKYQTTIENYESFIKSLSNDFDFNQVDKYKETILTAAICNENIKLIKYLLQKNIDINGNRKAESYPLEAACLKGNFDIVKLLCEQPSIKLDRKDDQSLIYACMYNEVKIAKYLLYKGLNPNKIIDERTALHWAIQEHHFESIKLLVAYGATINLLIENEQTPIRIAFNEIDDDDTSAEYKITIKIFKLLLESGANINLTDSDNSSVLISAVCIKHNIKLIEMLLDCGADPNIIDKEGRTALFYAKLWKKQEFAQLLIKHNAKQDIVDVHGNSLLDLEDERKRREVFIAWFYPEHEVEYYTHVVSKVIFNNFPQIEIESLLDEKLMEMMGKVNLLDDLLKNFWGDERKDCLFMMKSGLEKLIKGKI